ncbi:hypothetical protein GPX89_34370 [Nocardia sp. ET3-3]|uniref:Tox-PL domain-containing protein n=1 Tax=Nocardia terrae TaxID=2675851 RepID=A0A7K1V773_9NOCA|nr:hypothetical protein [Nocardia terrae]
MSRPTTIGGTGIRRWATKRRPSTLRPAPTPTTRWPAGPTEHGTKSPGSTPGWSRHRGPVRGFRNNCQSCVVSVEERLAGNEVTAVRRSDKAATDFTWPDDVLNAVGHGNSFHQVSGYKEIEQQLLDAGPGSRGIVHGVWLDENGLYESGHVFNVINRGGKIFYVDGQTGTWADLHNYSGFEFLRTN